MEVRYPEYQRLLVELDKEDQKEIRGHYLKLQGLRSGKDRKRLGNTLSKNCHTRSVLMMDVLKKIKTPTVENIGIDGSQAVAVLALHSYKDVIKRILRMYETEFKKNPQNIYYQAIPPLHDRLMILEQRKQLYGTNWGLNENGNLYLIPVQDFDTVDQRRSLFGLKALRRPVILSDGADKHPQGKGQAIVSDQREMTDSEFEVYAQYHLRKHE